MDDLAAQPTPAYGISTGFGALATRHIHEELRARLQENIVRSHAAGSGPEVEREVVRAMMLLRLSTLATASRCLVAPGRVVGMDFGHAEQILAGYDAPYDGALLDRCVAARTAQQAVYGLILDAAIPGLPERVGARLEWLGRQAQS